MEEITKNKPDLLHELVLDGLIEKLQSGDANSTDYGNAIKFLKDNPKTSPEEEARTKRLQASISNLDLPFPSNKAGESETNDF
jgi:hypothetical protein